MCFSRLFVAFCLFAALAFGWQKKSSFEVEYGFFKELGVADATLESNSKNYTIKIHVSATGFAKFLSRNREEIYSSSGYVENGQFVPTTFVQQRSYSDKLERTTYAFDHKIKKITKEKEKYEDNKLVSKSIEQLQYYAVNDILTLYFNIAENIKGIKPGEHKIFYAVGANPKDGRVDVMVPIGVKHAEVLESMGASGGDRPLIVIINQKIFQSENGELFILFDGNGETKKAVLKNVILFGDIRGIAKAKS